MYEATSLETNSGNEINFFDRAIEWNDSVSVEILPGTYVVGLR